MKDTKILFYTGVISLVVLITYVTNFYGASLSDNTTDWGAFGSYMGMGLSIVTIALIYITYREQRESNIIARYEQHILSITNTLNVLTEKHHESLEVAYNMFSMHFTISNIDLTTCVQDKTAKVCSYYYSIILNDYPQADNLKYLFQYLTTTIDYIRNEQSIPPKDKQRQITEMACLLPESLRVLFFCWILTHQKRLLRYYNNSGLFTLGDTTSSPLADVITFVCSGKIQDNEESDDIQKGEIKYASEDCSKEQFMDTYNRLYNKQNI